MRSTFRLCGMGSVGLDWFVCWIEWISNFIWMDGIDEHIALLVL